MRVILIFVGRLMEVFSTFAPSAYVGISRRIGRIPNSMDRQSGFHGLLAATFKASAPVVFDLLNKSRNRNPLAGLGRCRWLKRLEQIRSSDQTVLCSEESAILNLFPLPNVTIVARGLLQKSRSALPAAEFDRRNGLSSSNEVDFLFSLYSKN